MLSIKPRAVWATILAFTLLCLCLVFMLGMLVRSPSVQAYLFEQLGKTTGYDIKGTGLNLYFKGGLGFSATSIVAKSQLRQESVESSRLDVILNLVELIKGRVVPLRIYIFRPRIELATFKAEGFAKEGGGTILRQMMEAGLSGLKSAFIEDGRIIINDLPYGLKDLDLSLNSEVTGHHTRQRVKVKGGVTYRSETAAFSLMGTVTADDHQEGLSAAMKLNTDWFPINLVPCPDFLLFSKGSAKADIMLNARLGGPVSATGKILGEDAHFSVIEHGRTKEYDLSSFELFFDSSYFEQVIEISSVELHGPGFSASARSKVDFNNISNPHISLGVESPFMPLETFKRIFPTPVVPHLVEEIFFPICSGGDARLTDLTMNGTLDQFKHFCLPENKDILSMKVEWKDIVVEKDGKGLPFEKVSGEIGIEGQRLSLSISNAVFGGSTIKSAFMEINSLCGDHLYNITGKGLFELDDIKKQADLAFMPQAAVSALKEFKDFAGKMEAQIDLTLNPGFVNPRVINGEFLCKDCLIGRDDILLPLSLDEAHILVSNEYKGRFEGVGRWGRSEFQASGSTSDLWKTFKVNVSSRAQAEELLNLFFQGRQFPINNRGPVSCQMEIERMDDQWHVKGETDLKDVVMDKGPVFLDPPGGNDKAIFDIDFFPGKELRLNDLLIDLDGTGVKVKGSYDLINKDEIRLNVSTERLPLRGLGVQSQGGDLNVQGLLTCNAGLRVSLKDPKKTTMIGNASGQGISFAVSGLASSVTDCHFKLEFSGQDVSIHSLDMRVGQSGLDIKGRLKGWDGLKGELAVDAGYLNFGDFIAEESDSVQKAPGQGLLKNFIDRSELQVSLNTKKGKWKRLGLGPLHAQCLLRSGDFYVEQAEVKLEHGILSAKGYVKKEQGPERINIISNIKMAGQSASDILYSLGTDGKALEGTLALESNLTAKGASIKDLISGLTGNASLSMENGCITSSFSTVFKVLDVLSIMNIFKTRLPDLLTNGLYFETIEATADIKNGVISTDDLAIKGPILNAVVQGTVDLTRKWMDMIFWAQTLETLDTIVSWVPIIGYILTEKENAPKGIVIYPVQMRGGWNDLEIKLLPSVKNLGGGVINIFKRLLNTPGRIFKKISGGGKDESATAVNAMPEKDGQPVESPGPNEYLD